MSDMNAEKILEEIDKLKENCFLSEFENGYAAGAADMANAIKDVICANMGDGKDTNVRGNDDYIIFTINDGGVAEAYDDTYDVTIHCESESERKRVIGMLERYQGWIPVEERLPEDLEKVLVWYEYFRYGEYNCMFETYGIGWQLDGYWSGDVSGVKARCIAWRSLPESYKPK